jgi:hypothetical protein
MKMKFDVTYQDGTVVQAIALPRDFVAFERQYGKSIAAFGDQTQMEWVFYLAWSPLHRSGREPGDFDSFLDKVEDVQPVQDEETPAAATPFPTEVSPEISAP